MDRRSFLLASAGLIVAPPLEADNPDPYNHRRLLDPTGEPTSLAAAAKGGRLIVVVMKGSWCPVCMRQLRRLGHLRARLGRLGARVVGLTTDAPADNRRAARRAEIDWPILADPTHEIVSALDLWQRRWGHPMPAIVVFDRCGDERGRLVGRRPGQRPEHALLELLERVAADPERCSTRNA